MTLHCFQKQTFIVFSYHFNTLCSQKFLWDKIFCQAQLSLYYSKFQGMKIFADAVKVTMDKWEQVAKFLQRKFPGVQ